MKKKDGVALLSLVITIIVIIILAMISYSASSSTIKRATYTKYTSNMKQLEEALDDSMMKVRSQTIVKGKLLSNAQLYNYIAKGGTTDLDFVEKGKEPSYTVITDNSSIDMDLPEFNVNTNDRTGVKIVYAVTGDGTVFAWPPYKYKNEYHLNDNDTVESDKVGATGNVDVIISGKDTVIKIDDDGVLVNPDENVSGETIRTELERPTVSGVYTYNGYEQTVSLNGFDEEKMTIVNGSRKNAGTDVVVVGLKEPDKYKWKDETSNHITISWTIEKKEVSAVWTNLTFQYDGKSHIPMAKVQGMANEKINVSLSGAQVDGGTYTASVAISSVKGGSVDNYILSNSTVEYQILVSEIAVNASDYSGVYDGNEKTISLTVTNPVNGVDIYYSATTELNASNYSSAGSKTKPTVSTAGVTTIHYYITARNVPAKAGSNKVIIEKAPITSSVNMQDYRYGGTKQEPSVNGNIGNGNVTYYVNTVNTNDGGKNWAEIADSYTLNTGKYYMYAVIDETLNYKGVKTETKEFDITKISISPTLTMTGYTYGGTKTNPSIAGNEGNGEVTYYYNQTNSNITGSLWSDVSNGASLNAGQYYMYAVVETSGNYDEARTSAVPFTIAKKSVEVIWDSTVEFTYDGNEHAPTATVTSGVTGETLNITVTGAQLQTGTHTVTVTIGSVTGGKANVDNYTLANATKEFRIIKEGLAVGDYVNYTPKSKTITTDTTKTGYTSSQTLTTMKNTQWRIFSIDKITGEILITTQGATNLYSLHLQEATGYLHGAEELNRICKELYSSDTLTARSMTIEDLDKAVGYDPTTSSTYGREYEYTSGSYYTYQENGNTVTSETPKVASSSNKVKVKNTNYYYKPNRKNTTVGEILGSDLGWLASPFIEANSTYANFYMRLVNSSDVGGHIELHKGSRSINCAYRDPGAYSLHPVISLNANQIDTTEDGKDGTTLEKAWNLK